MYLSLSYAPANLMALTKQKTISHEPVRIIHVFYLKTKHHFNVCVSEHMGISAHTGKKHQVYQKFCCV